jgi:hypothetical protein
MKTTARFIISATTGLGLTAFTLFSAFAFGSASTATVLGFAFLAIYGLLEIAVLSYAAPRFEVRPVRVTRPAPVLVALPAPAAIELRSTVSDRRAA